ncbi:hypothetical protein [Pedobacter sp. Leaf250]|uniref:hypothetical protein n=1 Tax=Pedobacter sp. Leaf250 TaxID=2876559 RepID=UPI001E5F1F57|nr:hypothetical protein [Pedobacter sp. Leaf250]
MKSLIFRLIIIFNLFFVHVYGQKISSNTCDSLLLTKVEYEKCKRDTFWKDDFLVKANYIINYKTQLLPKYRVLRREMKLSPMLQKSINQLKLVYDSVLNNKIWVLEKEMDRNQKYVQPKAYLSSILSLQFFKFYPDVHAILFNEIHLSLNPKTTMQKQVIFKKYFNEVLLAIPAETKDKLEDITSTLTKDKLKLNTNGMLFMFQDEIPEASRKQCDIINFLLWAE